MPVETDFSILKADDWGVQASSTSAEAFNFFPEENNDLVTFAGRSVPPNKIVQGLKVNENSQPKLTTAALKLHEIIKEEQSKTSDFNSFRNSKYKESMTQTDETIQTHKPVIAIEPKEISQNMLQGESTSMWTPDPVVEMNKQPVKSDWGVPAADPWNNTAAEQNGSTLQAGSHKSDKNQGLNETLEHSRHAHEPDADTTCRNCGKDGHFARDCPEPPTNAVCFNCGQEGHVKADCTNERVFTGTCHVCQKDGHRAADCPDRSPETCKNCGQEGHKLASCVNNRARNLNDIANLAPEIAWKKMETASEAKDLDDFRQAFNEYLKAVPNTTYGQLETSFRGKNFNVYLIGREKLLLPTQTIMSFNGRLGMKYQLQFHLSPKPKRKALAEGWPSTPEENMQRLEYAGEVVDSGIPKCNNCNELGHISKSCKEPKAEVGRAKIDCALCGQDGHRARDCTEPKPESSADNVECRRCNEVGHFAKDCPSGGGPRTCRNCGEEGHMSRDCEAPPDPTKRVCRNCDETGHMSKECPKPRDYSRVKCNQCGQMGHTVARCKQAPQEQAEAAEEPESEMQAVTDPYTNFEPGSNW